MECHEKEHDGLRSKPRLMQMRWVAACDSGHIFDIPWKRWVGTGTTKSATHNPACTHERLSFYTAVKQGVSGYGNDIVSCKEDTVAGSNLIGKEGCLLTRPSYQDYLRIKPDLQEHWIKGIFANPKGYIQLHANVFTYQLIKPSSPPYDN
jgi:hypothetical protein